MSSRTNDVPAVTAAPSPPGGRGAFLFGPLIAAVVYATGTLGSTIRPSVLAIIVSCSAVAGGLIVAAVMTAGTWWSAVYASACGAVASGWLAFALRSRPASWPAAVALLVPAAALIALYPVMRAREHRAAQDALRAAEEAARSREQRRWPDLIARIGHQGVRFAGREDTLAGYKVHLRLPGSGRVTYSALAPATEQLEVAARLRHGSLRFERGDQAHKVILHVAERDVLAETVPLPAGHGTLSITRPVPLGLFEDGQVCAVTLREVATLIVGLRGSGKALALDTPMPTPGGWTTMGEIRAGDVVYDEAGAPCQVTDAWDIRFGRPCYEIEFSDGSTIVADAEHQWLTWDRNTRKAHGRAAPGSTAYPDDWAIWSPVTPVWSNRKAYAPGERERMRDLRAAGLSAARIGQMLGRSASAVQQQWKRPEPVAGALSPRTTTELAATLRSGHEWNHVIPAAKPLALPDVELPIDPYVLGYLLGDGDTRFTGRVACDPQDRKWLLAEFRAAGYAARPHREPGHFGVPGITKIWRSLKLDQGKNIPLMYQRGSVGQRLALVQGLIDSDGYVDNHGCYRFTNTSRALAEGFRALVSTLGGVAQVHKRSGRVRAGRVSADSWEVIVPSSLPLARLPRKALVARHEWKREQVGRYITAIRPVPSVPVRCIAVDSPSHLYLVGESCIPTHNSNLLNVLLAQLARCPDVLIFAIDLKGGRMAAPWIEPWLAGRTSRPVVDWLATDREEAERMLRALLRAVDARSRSGVGGEKITPSPRQPAILLVCDEIAVILGIGTGGPRTSLDGVTNATLAGLATQLVMTGRSEAIDLIMATQRGAVTMTGSADLKSQCALRIGLGVASEADARLIIPDDLRIAADLARLHHPGTGIVQQGKDGRVVPVKFYRIEHEAISQIAERYGPIRPGPDKLLEEALGEDYATRWLPHRAARIPGISSRPLVPAGIAAQNGRAHEPPAALATGLGPGAESSPGTEFGPGTGAGPLAGVGPGPGMAVTQDDGHLARQQMIVMLKSAGVRGMTVRRIAEQFAADGREIAQQTIHRWLTEEAAAGRVETASYGRWKWPADR